MNIYHIFRVVFRQKLFVKIQNNNFRFKLIGTEVKFWAKIAMFHKKLKEINLLTTSTALLGTY